MSKTVLEDDKFGEHTGRGGLLNDGQVACVDPIVIECSQKIDILLAFS